MIDIKKLAEKTLEHAVAASPGKLEYTVDTHILGRFHPGSGYHKAPNPLNDADGTAIAHNFTAAPELARYILVVDKVLTWVSREMPNEALVVDIIRKAADKALEELREEET